MTIAPTQVVYASANPTNTTHLAVKQEAQRIMQGLAKLRLGHAFNFNLQHDVTFNTLDSVLDFKAEIVHFSGHGTKDGWLILNDDAGKAHTVDPRDVADLFGVLRHNIRLVVLNACYMSAQASQLIKHIDIVVGTTRAVTDDAAIAFAVKFYERLAKRDSVYEAFEVARLLPPLAKLGPSDTPLLLSKLGVSPDRIKLFPIENRA